MFKYILIAIGIISCIITIREDICAYHRKEYDPIGFGVRKGYEWKSNIIIAYFGYLLPLNYFACYVKSNIYTYVYAICLLCIFSVSKTILNYKCYCRNKRKKILMNTIIMDSVAVFIITFGAMTLFK